MLQTPEKHALINALSIGSVDSSVNWDDIFDWALNHQLLLPLVSRMSRINCFTPSKQLQINEQIKKIEAQENRKTLEYTRVCTLLQRKGFTFITFKGLTLTYTIYRGKEYSRRFNDLDIIAHPNVCDDIYAILRNEGYPIYDNRDEADVELYKNLIHHYPALRLDTSNEIYTIEVHHRITHQFCPYEFNIDKLIERSTTLEIHNASIPVPCTEDHLILLCYNLFKSEVQAPCYSLKYLLDILVYVEECNIDWSKVIEYAKEQHLEMPVYYAFYRTSQIFGEALAKAGFVIDTVNSIKPSDFEESKDFIYEFHTLSDKPMGQWQEPYEDRLFWDKDQLYARYYLKFYEYHENINFSNLCEQFGLPFRTIK